MLTTDITRDTRLCISLSGRPSNLGTRFHNFLYAELGLNYVYKAFTTKDIAAAVGGIRALGIRGAGISMPFKAAVIPLIDELDQSASVIESVNTIVNMDGQLHGYNTDYSAVATLLDDRAVPHGARVAVVGSGGMARACVAALRDRGNTDGVVIARNEIAGRALAEAYGYGWAREVTDEAPEVLVNATPIGMAGGAETDALPVPADVVRAARFVLEVVAMPPETPLSRLATESGLTVITGTEVQALQAADQFALYTGVRPTADQVVRAGAYSRA
jgi:shikimate dehydrogenase